MIGKEALTNMLYIVAGRAGSGKTTRIYEQIKKNCENHQSGQLLIVPDQFSHTAERRLSLVCGASAPMYAETLTFNTLASRIFLQSGGLARHFLDDGSRLVLIRLAHQTVRKLLTVYGDASGRPELLLRLLDTIAELKNFRVLPKQLLDAAKNMECDSMTAKKLSDIAYIADAYDALLTGELGDPEDRLSYACDRAERDGFFTEGHRHIYADGFFAFAHDEYRILGIMLEQGADVTITLMGDETIEDPYIDRSDLFAPTADILKRLTRFCLKNDIKYDITYLRDAFRFKAPAMKYLERAMYAYDVAPYSGECTGISMHTAPDRRSECESAAAIILGWARDGLRWRDMAVVCRKLDIYRDELRAVFAGANIPVFLDDITDVASKSFFTMISAAFDAVTGDFRLDDMIRYMKTGMAGLSVPAVDLMENYCERWRIRGLRWIDGKPWEQAPDGFFNEEKETGDKKLRIINRLRKKLSEPLKHLKQNVSGTRRAEEHCAAVYAFAIETGMEKRTELRAKTMEQNGETRKASEYRQLWNIFCDILEQCVLCMGSEYIAFDEFAALFKLMLKKSRVGVIPTSIDEVSVCEAGRARWTEPRRLVVIGMNDGIFPDADKREGIFTDRERELLREQQKLVLAPDSMEQLFDEQLIAYRTFFAASERLAFTWVENGKDRPSVYIDRIRYLFPNLGISKVNQCVSPWLALTSLIGARGKDARLQDTLKSFDCVRAPIIRAELAGESLKKPIEDETLIDKLYGMPIKMSPTKMESFHSCKYAFFLKYGLGLRPFRKAEFSPMEAGTYAHFVFERTAGDVTRKGGWKNRGVTEIQDIAKKYMEQFKKEMFPIEVLESQRFLQIISRREENLLLLLERLREEMELSQFQPFAFELEFGIDENDAACPMFVYDGKTLCVTGRVDRADKWEHGEQTYLRIVDYKTGATTFNYTDIVNGLKMQLPIYLLELSKDDKRPAGFLYAPMRGRVADMPKNSADEDVRKKRDDMLKYSGLLLKNDEVLEAMEPSSPDGTRFIPISRLKSGALTAYSSVVTDTDFEAIREMLDSMIKKMMITLINGDVDADPFVKHEKTACDYCDYHAVCRMDFYNIGGNEHPRYLKNCRQADFLAMLDKLKLEKLKSGEQG